MATQSEYVAQLRRTLVSRQIERLSVDREPSEWERRQIEEAVSAMTELQIATAFGIRPKLRTDYQAPRTRQQCGPTS